MDRFRIGNAIVTISRAEKGRFKIAIDAPLSVDVQRLGPEISVLKHEPQHPLTAFQEAPAT